MTIEPTVGGERVHILGEVIAHLDPETGEVARITFTPSASSAGYFGSGLVDADTGGVLEQSGRPYPSQLWPKIADRLASNGGTVDWTE